MEIWRPLLLNTQDTEYEISSHGNVRNLNHELQNDKFKRFSGHYTFDFKLNNKVQRIKIHRVVAITFIDNPHKLKHIKHIDGNMFNNHVENLKWVSTIQFQPINMNEIDTNMLKPKFSSNVDKSVSSKVVEKQVVEKQDEKHLDDIVIEWKPIYINGEISNYDISNDGQIRVTSTLKLRSSSSHTGYYTCSLIHKKYVKQVHRLVAEAFIPNDNVDLKKHVNHKNYDKLDNRVENLEWITVSENNKHAHQNEERKKTRIPIIRKNLDGTNPVRYDFVNQAREEFGSQVTHCLTGRAKQAYGYIWEYETIPTNKIFGKNLDLTTFKQIENHPNFLISIDGKVYNNSRNSFLTPRQTGSYMSVVLDGKHYCIHRLIATYFINKPKNYNDKWIVNHKDGNKLNNNVNNLEWLSQSDNIQHMYDTGMRKDAKQIIQKDLEGNIIQEYMNAGHVSKVLGRQVNQSILQACKHNVIRFGYKWEFKQE